MGCLVLDCIHACERKSGAITSASLLPKLCPPSDQRRLVLLQSQQFQQYLTSLLFDLLRRVVFEHGLHALVEMLNRLIVDVEGVLVHVVEPNFHTWTAMMEELLEAGTPSTSSPPSTFDMYGPVSAQCGPRLAVTQASFPSSANNFLREASRSSPKSSAESTPRWTKLYASLQIAAWRRFAANPGVSRRSNTGCLPKLLWKSNAR